MTKVSHNILQNYNKTSLFFLVDPYTDSDFKENELLVWDAHERKLMATVEFKTGICEIIATQRWVIVALYD